MEYGKRVLCQHGFWSKPGSIQPGSFLTGRDDPCLYRLVSDEDGVYVGIALDRERPAEPGLLMPAELGAFSRNVEETDEIGELAEVDRLRTKICHPLADRAYDLAVVLEQLLGRFHSDRRNEQTGFLAERIQDTGIIWTVGPDGEPANLVRCVAAPLRSYTFVAENGFVYAAHFKGPAPSWQTKPHPAGWHGRLTLLGQIVCIASVLRDRLGELVACREPSLVLGAMSSLAGRVKHPIDWNLHERGDLERVRGELQAWQGTLSRIPEDLISHEEAAALLGCSARTIVRRIKDGVLTPHGPMRKVSQAQVLKKLSYSKPRKSKKN